MNEIIPVYLLIEFYKLIILSIGNVNTSENECFLTLGAKNQLNNFFFFLLFLARNKIMKNIFNTHHNKISSEFKLDVGAEERSMLTMRFYYIFYTLL